jgi:hypothetical protein
MIPWFAWLSLALCSSMLCLSGIRLSSFDLDWSFSSIERRTSSLLCSLPFFLTLPLLSPYWIESPKGTIFYRCRHTEDEIVECISMLGDRNSLAAIHRIKGIKEETVMKWLKKASAHVEQFKRLVRKKKLSRVQLDALWTYVGHKGEKGADLKKLQEGLFGVEKL